MSRQEEIKTTKAAATGTDNAGYPIDKVNSAIWSVIQDFTGKQETLSPKEENPALNKTK